VSRARATFGLALVAALALAGWGCSKGEGADDVAPADTRVPVTLADVRRDTLTVRVSFVGRLDAVPGGRALLTAPAAAVVGRLATEVGARVKRGQLLLTLDAPDLAADATSKTAEADRAKSEARRQDELLREGIAARKDVEQADATARSATADAASARALYARARITSPLAGTVDEVLAHPGERVEPGAELVSVVNTQALEFEAAVPVSELAHLHAGQVALVTVEGLARAQIGTVRAVAPAVDSVTNAGRVLVRLPNPGGLLRVGAGATAVVEVEIHAGVLSVPEGALLPGEDGVSVLVLKPDSTVEKRTVTVGVKDGGRVEVAGTLTPGEHVVASGGYGLDTGMRVRATGRKAP